MLERLRIRDETSGDAAAVAAVTASAFTDVEVSNHTEQFVVEALRAAGALTVSLVAEVDGEIVGHLALSPVTMSDGTADWHGLGPVSVVPEHQGHGIGAALIEEGLSRLRALGAKGCCLVGHPGYYRRFGFENSTELEHEGVPPEFFFVLALNGGVPRGFVVFHPAFGATG